MNQIKTVPYSLEAEQAVIGGLMLNQSTERAQNVLAMLKPESFYAYQHQRIFTEMQALLKANQPVDLLTLDTRLKAQGISDEVGGLAYLAEISNNRQVPGIFSVTLKSCERTQ
ncbi:DnaB-like helicase N-terminal domain-containing protein [Rodentibacter haemolyticus]|uniref:DnaB-like helicase N-terminal domain-containing protein n=1 Tax=Rodentibacter haemolyticus TaxID=2778911 RepID=UPI001E328CAE|nr:DnaB-like helicase N-terminal domain-containing protein [Rodentibacter haemolyticus]